MGYAPSKRSRTSQVGYRGLLGLSGALLLLVLGLFGVDRLYRPNSFLIKQVEISGALELSAAEQIKRTVENAIDGNYFSVDLHRLEHEVAALPGVFKASLRRRWPSTLLVEVVEIQPIALWGEDRWLNFNGDLVERGAVANLSGENRAGLPHLEGRLSQQRLIWQTFREWSGLLAKNGLHLAQLRLDNRGLWRLRLSLSALQQSAKAQKPYRKTTQVELVVDDDVAGLSATDKLQRFIRALNQGLIEDFIAMQRVDLRYPNGFAVAWQRAPDALSRRTE